jgi:hypothetical protein
MAAADPTFIALQSALAGEYSLERELGRGGMGIVYLAREVVLDRLVAIKALPADMTARDDIRERFLREARTAASLSHPNIVPIHRVSEAGGIPYFVMTFVSGETLGERLRARGPIGPTLLTRILRDVALALGYAHGRGVIHRDVKPDNILIEEGSERSMVTDFGIARVAADSEEDGRVMGTAHFMSPEQAMGEPVDGRSDIYALGIVGFISASGRLPFADPSLLEYTRARNNEAAPAIASLASGVPPSVCAVIDRCLRRLPDDRFATAEEIATALDAATAPVKARLPVALRVWASSETPLLSMYQISSAVAGSVAAVEAYRRVAGYTPGLNLSLLVGWALLPIIPITAFQLRKTRRALAAGYNISDLRLALRTWIAERREDLAFETSGPEPVWTRILRWGFAGPAIAAPLILLAYGLAGAPREFNQLFGVAGLIIGLLCLGSFLVMSGAGVPVEPPKFRRNAIGRFARWLWDGRFGAWLAKRLTPKNAAVPEAHFRPTELALGVAVDELFAALPTAYRQQVGDLPAIGGKLMTEAAWLRSEVDRLQELRTHARGNETQLIDPMLAGARNQLSQTVGALERMRLELLRLHGGATDTRRLTTSLDAAREMVEDLVRLRQAEAELGGPRRRLPIDSRTPSPA